jgi:hypothetical protein
MRGIYKQTLFLAGIMRAIQTAAKVTEVTPEFHLCGRLRPAAFLANLVIAFSSGLLITACSGDGEGGVMGTSSTSESSSRGIRCSDYSSQAAAQAALNSGIKGLDADRDGIACEVLK